MIMVEINLVKENILNDLNTAKFIKTGSTFRSMVPDK